MKKHKSYIDNNYLIIHYIINDKKDEIYNQYLDNINNKAWFVK
jgi:hypothetical protein